MLRIDMACSNQPPAAAKAGSSQTTRAATERGGKFVAGFYSNMKSLLNPGIVTNFVVFFGRGICLSDSTFMFLHKSAFRCGKITPQVATLIRQKLLGPPVP